jgi:hypothetical protein
MPSRANKRKKAKAIPGQGQSLIRPYHRMMDQLSILRHRINERIPLFRSAMATGEGWKSQGDELRLDFETYIMVLARFFRLCRRITGLTDFGDERIVKSVRAIRDQIVEHGFDDASGQGDRGFFCGGHGPVLVLDGGIECLSMAQIDDGVDDLLDRHKLKRDQIVFSHFSPIPTHTKAEWEELLGLPPVPAATE